MKRLPVSEKKDQRIRISMDVRSVQLVEEAVQWVRKEWRKIDQFDDDDIFNALVEKIIILSPARYLLIPT